MTIFTKLAATIFAAFDSAGNQRRVDNGEVVQWGTELERLVSTGGFKGIDAQGPFSGRAAYNAQPKGFTYLSVDGDGATISLVVGFIKKSNTSGDWSVAIPWQGPVGPDGEAGPAGEGFSPAGAWNSGTTYAKNDMVSFGPRSFVSFAAANLGNEPPSTDGDDANWQFVPAAVGPEGPQGPVGGTGATGVKGDTGATGPANTLTIGTVSQGVAGASVTGAAPNQALNLTLPKGDTGATGAEGNDGWTPVLAVVSDSARRVQRVVDWTGGSGTKPATGKYVGATGLVDLIGDGVDIRGASGTGTGDMVKATYDPRNVQADALHMDNMTEGTDAKVMTSGERTKLAGIPANADKTTPANVGAAIAGVSQVPEPADGDRLGGVLSGDTTLFWITIGNLKTLLKTYFDGFYALATRTITAGTGLTGGGSLAANRTVAIDKATAANVRAGTADKVVTPDGVVDAMAWVALTAGAAPAIDHAAGVNRTITHTANATMGAPSNAKPGWPLNFDITPSTFTTSWNAVFKFGTAGAPSITARRIAHFMCRDASTFVFLGLSEPT